MTGDLVFYVRLELRPECVEEWKAAVTDVIEQMSREAAFVSCSNSTAPKLSKAEVDSSIRKLSKSN